MRNCFYEEVKEKKYKPHRLKYDQDLDASMVAEKSFHDDEKDQGIVGPRLTLQAQRYRQKEMDFLSQELLLLEDFYRTLKQEFSLVPNRHLRQEENALEKIAECCKYLNFQLINVKKREAATFGRIAEPFRGFDEKMYVKGYFNGLNIATETSYIACDNWRPKNTIPKQNFIIQNNVDLQIVPLSWLGHATGMIIDHNNKKVVFFDPNGAYAEILQDFLKKEAVEKKIKEKDLNKKNILEVFVGEKNAKLLETYDLIDANANEFDYHKDANVETWGNGYDLNVGNRPGQGSCAFVTKRFLEEFVDTYCKKLSINRSKKIDTKRINDYESVFGNISTDMEKSFSRVSVARYLRESLKSAFERFCSCDAFKHVVRQYFEKLRSIHEFLALLDDTVPKASSKLDVPKSVVAKYFPKTLAKFEVLLRNFVYMENEKDLEPITWDKAVEKAKEQRRMRHLNKRREKAEKNKALRKTMSEGFKETFGDFRTPYQNSLKRSQYLSNMVRAGTDYKKTLFGTQKETFDTKYGILNILPRDKLNKIEDAKPDFQKARPEEIKAWDKKRKIEKKKRKFEAGIKRWDSIKGRRIDSKTQIYRDRKGKPQARDDIIFDDKYIEMEKQRRGALNLSLDLNNAQEGKDALNKSVL